MSAPGPVHAGEGVAPDGRLDVATVVQMLPAWWDEWAQAGEQTLPTTEGPGALHPLRARLAQGLRDLQHALGGAAESGSFIEALRALATLVDDPQASLPGSLATALVLTQDRLADLKLRKHLAARDPNWSRSLLQAPASVPVSVPGMEDDVPLQAASVNIQHEAKASTESSIWPSGQLAAGRDWWSVPVEGLTGSNQLFLVETRELLRSAELSLQALRLEPADYAEQMVLCRSFQAVAVAAASMGLSRLAAVAGESERRVDELLEGGCVFDAAVLSDIHPRVETPYVELPDLRGSTVAVGPRRSGPLAV